MTRTCGSRRRTRRSGAKDPEVEPPEVGPADRDEAEAARSIRGTCREGRGRALPEIISVQS